MLTDIINDINEDGKQTNVNMACLHLLIEMDCIGPIQSYLFEIPGRVYESGCSFLGNNFIYDLPSWMGITTLPGRALFSVISILNYYH